MKFSIPSRKASAVCVAILVAVQAGAAPLAPNGGGLATAEPDPITATPVYSTSISWGTPSLFSGTLTSSVLTNDANNVLGGLTFTYQLTLDSTSSFVASGLTIGGFSLFLTDVSYQTPLNGGVAPLLVSRSPSGQDIQFDFKPYLGGSFLGPGQYSALLVVQTDALSWSESSATVIDSVGFGPFLTVAPVDVLAVPEPSAFALVLLGLSGLGWMRARSKRHA